MVASSKPKVCRTVRRSRFPHPFRYRRQFRYPRGSPTICRGDLGYGVERQEPDVTENGEIFGNGPGVFASNDRTIHVRHAALRVAAAPMPTIRVRRAPSVSAPTSLARLQRRLSRLDFRGSRTSSSPAGTSYMSTLHPATPSAAVLTETLKTRQARSASSTATSICYRAARLHLTSVPASDSLTTSRSHARQC